MSRWLFKLLFPRKYKAACDRARQSRIAKGVCESASLCYSRSDLCDYCIRIQELGDSYAPGK